MKKKSYLCKRIDTISKYGNVAVMADRTIGYGRLDRKALWMLIQDFGQPLLRYLCL